MNNNHNLFKYKSIKPSAVAGKRFSSPARISGVILFGCFLTVSQVLAQVPPAPQAAAPGAKEQTKQVTPAVAPATTPANEQKALEQDSDRTPAIKTNGNCLIKNGTLLTVTQRIIVNSDILVQNGKITQIGRNISAPAGTIIIDATGKFVTPGLVDAHSHLTRKKL